ncbi:MAG: single-stranded-DNA-specific exonuclease RecJ [Verrucomicrobia bacterium]|jgi:single-stranded-DNA-specific exonuclease|nr:single-stranded-DNA-specific exonuclease RecJ [Verrucomicrobiota bacterium]
MEVALAMATSVAFLAIICMNRLWSFPEAMHLDSALAVSRQLDIAPGLARVLAKIGLVDEGKARQFLFPRLRDLRDPFEIGGIRGAVDRIFQAIDRGETIVLYGDYDVDGVTSVALLHRVMRAFGTGVRTFLPHRLEEGYGLSEEGVQRCLAMQSPQLLIALDCGTAAADRIREIEAAGVDVIVVDHHETKSRLPDCRAFVNPKTGASYHYLCTAGLVFKLCHALLRTRRLPEFDLKKYLDLVAIATIADLVPLIEENRTFVQHGLRQLEQTEWIGLRALMQVAGVTPPIRPVHVGYRIGPRLNAAGRLGVAQDALELLLAEDAEKALLLARSLDWQNRDRQSVEQKTLDEALVQLSYTFVPDRDAAIVVASRGWHPGVVGIVASRLTKQFHRPTVVIAFDDSGEGKGSGRSVAGLSLVRALEECGQYLLQFGGHEMAAGVRIEFDQLELFSAAFRAAARRMLTPDLLQPRLELDAELTGPDITLKFLSCQDLLQPFGIGNPQPLFFIRRVAPAGEPRLLKEKHRLLMLRHGGCLFSAIHFNGAQFALPEPPWDIAFYLEANCYQSRVQLQLYVESIRQSGSDYGR